METAAHTSVSFVEMPHGFFCFMNMGITISKKIVKNPRKPLVHFLGTLYS
jgi:hypothetical protein